MNKRDTRRFKEYAKIRHYCPKCGHTNSMPVFVDYKICSWCKNMVFKDKKTEFEYRINQANIRARKK